MLGYPMAPRSLISVRSGLVSHPRLPQIRLPGKAFLFLLLLGKMLLSVAKVISV